jgi:hypothetical protein
MQGRIFDQRFTSHGSFFGGGGVILEHLQNVRFNIEW